MYIKREKRLRYLCREVDGDLKLEGSVDLAVKLSPQRRMAVNNRKVR